MPSGDRRGTRSCRNFLDALAENYGAGMRPVDFSADPEASREAINDWVSDRTEDRIQDLIPKGLINRLTRLVLANAIYFNAAWHFPFDEKRTSTGPFHLLSGSQCSSSDDAADEDLSTTHATDRPRPRWWSCFIRVRRCR